MFFSKTIVWRSLTSVSYTHLDVYKRQVLNDMVALAQPLPEYDILRSIPGIAETTATSIIGELGDIRRSIPIKSTLLLALT